MLTRALSFSLKKRNWKQWKCNIAQLGNNVTPSCFWKWQKLTIAASQELNHNLQKIKGERRRTESQRTKTPQISTRTKLLKTRLQISVPSWISFSLLEWWLVSRKRVAKEKRKGWDWLVILIIWKLWKERNAKVFEGISLDLQDVESSVMGEVGSWHKQERRDCLSFL